MSIHASVWFTSWRDNSSAKRGYRSSAFSGSFVPGLIIGSGLFFISAVMLYHRVGISASGSMNFFLFSIVLYSLIELLHVYRSLISPQLYLLIITSSHHHIITSSHHHIITSSHHHDLHDSHEIVLADIFLHD